MRATPSFLVALGLALVLAGCGDAGSDAGPAATGADPAAGACLAGDPDCEDVPGTTGPAITPPASGAVPVADAKGIDGPFAVAGYYVDDGSGPKLCEALAESFPPQCGGAFISLGPGFFVRNLQTAEGVSWTDEPVELEGQFSFGVFTAIEVG